MLWPHTFVTAFPTSLTLCWVSLMVILEKWILFSSIYPLSSYELKQVYWCIVAWSGILCLLTLCDVVYDADCAYAWLENAFSDYSHVVSRNMNVALSPAFSTCMRMKCKRAWYVKLCFSGMYVEKLWVARGLFPCHQYYCTLWCMWNSSSINSGLAH